MSRLFTELDKRSPTTAWEIVEVTFGSADVDQEVQTTLRPADPEQLDYRILQASGPPLVYHDTSASRVPWTSGLIRLRSAVAGLKVVLFLTIPTEKRTIEGGSKLIASSMLDGGNIAYTDVANVFTQAQEEHTALNNRNSLLSNTSDAYKWARRQISGGGLAFDLYNGSSWSNIFGFLASGLFSPLQGISFPTTQNPSSGSNDLDDYEEGTWTPAIGGSGGQSGQSYNTQVGRYLKVGQLVLAQCQVELASKGTIIGNVQIRNLPFTCGPTASWPVAIRWNSLNTTKVYLMARVLANSAVADIEGIGAASQSSTGGIFDSDLQNGSIFEATILYRASA